MEEKSISCHYETNVLGDDDCRILLSSYMNMIAHAILLHSSSMKSIDAIDHEGSQNVTSSNQPQAHSTSSTDSTESMQYTESSESVEYAEHVLPDVSSFMRPDVIYWKDDPILASAYSLRLISEHTGRGIGTQFCHNPEKNILVHGNRRIYDIFHDIIYRGKLLMIQPTGYMVFPPHSYATPWKVFKNFMDKTNESLRNTYYGIVVIEADDELYGGHRVETLDDIDDHAELLEAFFHPTTGHPMHRVTLCTGRNPFTLPQAFNISVYNDFRKLYYGMMHDPNAYEGITNNIYLDYCRELLSRPQRPKAVVDALEWHSRDLRKGSIFIWNDRIPFRFACTRGPSCGRSYSQCPLICADLVYVPIEYRSVVEIQNDTIAFANRTASPNPLHHISFVSKNSNKFERQVVRLMTSKTPYTSPYCMNKDYWKSIPSALLYALRGLDSADKPFLWDDFYSLENE